MVFLIRILEKTSTKVGLTVLFAVYAVVFGGLLKTLHELTKASGGFGILDFDVGYSRERVLEVLGSYGETGMALYSRIQILDLINPAVYSTILSSVIFLLWRNRNVDWVVAVPIISGLLDYLENFTLFLLSKSFPDVSADLVTFSSSLSVIKTIALYTAVLVLILGAALRLRS